MEILVTGARGFIGKNLVAALRRRRAINLWQYDSDSSAEMLEEALGKVDAVFHLAGVNRPQNARQFMEINVKLTQNICETLRRLERKPTIVLSSSTQAILDNPYGISKRQAEDLLFRFAVDTGSLVAVFRLPGVFGKWCRPNYNSVVATFCHNIARDVPIDITDPRRELELVYIDDVIRAFLYVLDNRIQRKADGFCHVEPKFRITLGRLAELIKSFREGRDSLMLPDFSDRFIRCLYATYASYIPQTHFAYNLKQHNDDRGELAEVLRSSTFGQIFVSHTRPGIKRGDHYHDTKVEKFIVVQGEAVVRFRDISGEDVIEYPVSGKHLKVLDIPPGYAHSIENIGNSDLVVMFWANEVFDPDEPDTIYEAVLR